MPHIGGSPNLPTRPGGPADALATAIAGFDQAGKAMVAVLGQLAARLPGIDANFVPRMSGVTGDLGTAAGELVTVARAHATREEVDPDAIVTRFESALADLVAGARAS